MKSMQESVSFGPIDVHVGKRVKIRRKSRGLSQASLAGSLGISFQQVQKYEAGANRIGASRLFQLSNLLDVPVSFFFDDMPRDIAGHRQAGTRADDNLGSPDATDLIRSYSRIASPDLRQSFRNLAKEIARNG